MAGRVIQGFFVRPDLPSTGRAGVRVLAAPQRSGPVAVQRKPGPPTLAGRGLGTEPRAEIDPTWLGLARSGGMPLPSPLRAHMERAFNTDFSQVRVHVGPQAPRIGALAFTTGNDIYFAPGRFQPDSPGGQRLIGHELAHVVQQRKGLVSTAGPGLSVVRDRALEAEADRMAARAMTGLPPVGAPGATRGPPVTLRARSIQRMQDDSDYSYKSESDDSSSEMDEEVLIIAAANYPAWKRGVAQGFPEGWDEAITDEGQLAVPPLPRLVAIGQAGPPALALILAVQNNPPAEYIIDEADIAFRDGRSHGHQQGYDAGAAHAYQLFGWLRGNYPAIPGGLQVAALALNGGMCVYCNASPSTQVDHVYPVQKHWMTIGYLNPHNLGSVNQADNLVGACQPCNGAKSNRYLTGVNAWQPPGWLVGAWFPFCPGVIPPKRGGPLTPATW